jgi:propane monooxygenase small subunit
MLAHDEVHGEENQATMRSWLKTWTPRSVAASRALQPIWSQPGEKVIRFEESLEHSRRRFEEMLASINLDAKELDA